MAERQTEFMGRQEKQHGLFALCARMILWAVFIYTSIDKIAHSAVSKYLKVLEDAGRVSFHKEGT